ncbi:MAG: DUF1343 domain-containing protein [Chlamydiales bacterium]|nr:DUF1343 domain-containing protein [Chlamydiales bacterium]
MLDKIIKFVNISFLFLFMIQADIRLGVDRFFTDGFALEIKGKNVALYTNHTGINSERKSTIALFREKSGKDFQFVAIFTPEHGINGSSFANEKVDSQVGKIPIYSLHGDVRRPSESMLKNVEVIVCDIQDIGVRSYTYATTLFYIMEEAAKKKIAVVVLDRPNPLGDVVDGPMLNDKYRSFVGHINVPYCHGMTLGELAMFFNEEYNIRAALKVVSMQGYKRDMVFYETGLSWIPTSPHIPEADTPFFYAATGLMGDLSLVNIGVGYTLPFKIVGAPWIDADRLAKLLNDQKLTGVYFSPFHFKPFFGLYKGEECHGIIIHITNAKAFKPLIVQYVLLGTLKNMYPDIVEKKLKELPLQKKEAFCKTTGGEEIYSMLVNEKYVIWKLMELHKKERAEFVLKREKYLVPEYK